MRRLVPLLGVAHGSPRAFVVDQKEFCQGKQVTFDECAMPECSGKCVPENCELRDWDEWAACLCDGLRERTRAVFHPNNECGLPCKDSLVDTENCKKQCMKLAIPCELKPWSDWSSCDDGQLDQSVRDRQYVDPKFGGVPCEMTDTRAIRPCRVIPLIDVDCSWYEWSEWSACTCTCDGGQKTRDRSVDKAPRGNGQACDALHKTEIVPCNTDPCIPGCKPVDGVWDEWKDWEPCSATCGGGIHWRHRDQRVMANECGTHAMGLDSETENCGMDACGELTQCQLGEWSGWSDCSCSCNGVEHRARVISQYGSGGGDETHCNGGTKQVRACNVDGVDGVAGSLPECAVESNVDCKLSDWTDGKCSKSCGGGQHTRERSVLVQSANGGIPCDDDLSTTEPCNTEACTTGEQPSNCQWQDWHPWGACDKCGGQKKRSRGIAQLPKHLGEVCKFGDSEETADCPFHCGSKTPDWWVWQDWSSGECSASCGTGYIRKTRPLTHVVGVDGDTPPPAAILKAGQISNVDWQAGKQTVYETCEAPSCGGCDPQNCALRAWDEWGACLCDGLRERHRVVQQPNNECGEPCNGALIETQACDSPCLKSPTNGEWGEWSEWAVCDLTIQTTRNRDYTTPVHGGSGVVGETQQTKPCPEIETPFRKDCEWGEWETWSECSCKCDGGQMTRDRSVRSSPRGDGKRCDPLTKTEIVACNTMSCDDNAGCSPVSGEWGEWGTFGECSAECGGGVRWRRREQVRMANECGRRAMGNETIMEVCNTQPCPGSEIRNCEFGGWDSWSSCSCTCGGISHRARVITRYGTTGGEHCLGHTKEVEACNNYTETAGCLGREPVDCVLGLEVAQACTAECGGGQLLTTRTIHTPSAFGGRPCTGSLSSTVPCNTQPCPESQKVDCQWGEWHEWGACDKCGGQKKRSRSIKTMPNGGAACEFGDSEETVPCPYQCHKKVFWVWSQWRASICQTSEQTDIGKQCGVGFIKKTRSLQQTTEEEPGAFEAQAGVDVATSQTTYETCNMGPCSDSCKDGIVDCKLRAWDAWSDCLCDGLQERTRAIENPNNECGKPCEGALIETMQCESACNIMQCKLEDWSDWSSCSTSASQYQQVRTREYSTPKFGSAGCKDSTRQIKPCPDPPPPEHTDCVWGDWDGWSSCSCKCDGGQMSRDRSVKTAPKGAGKLCEAKSKTELAPCNTQPCGGPVCEDGQWSEWKEWDQCTATCNGGVQWRGRDVAKTANECGIHAQGDSYQVEACNADPCTPTDKVDCEFNEWNEWSECSCSCNGIVHRSRVIIKYNSGGGEHCEGATKEVQSCNTAADNCGKSDPVDCVFSGWYEKRSCSATCGGGQIVSERTVLTANDFGGNPCQGDLIKVEGCALEPCPSSAQDCKWNDWNDWGSCGKCDGQKTRTRTILQMAENFGNPCSPEHSQETTRCESNCGHTTKYYCEWSDWSVDKCSSTCGKGFQRKERSLQPSMVQVDSDGNLKPQQLYQGRSEITTHSRDRLQDLTISFACGFLVCFLVLIVGFRMFNRQNRDVSHFQREPDRHHLISMNSNAAE